MFCTHSLSQQSLCKNSQDSVLQLLRFTEISLIVTISLHVYSIYVNYKHITDFYKSFYFGNYQNCKTESGEFLHNDCWESARMCETLKISLNYFLRGAIPESEIKNAFYYDRSIENSTCMT